MANIIPMSGSGSRFSDEGYLLPKPLISVSGQPMIWRVIEAMPPADKWIFVVRKEHEEQYAIGDVIRTKIPNAIIVVEENPWGQAPSCMMAMPHLDPDEEMFVVACDNSFLYNHDVFNSLKENPLIDAIMWTFTNNPLLKEKPEAWGWVKLAEDGQTIQDMSVKIPVSDDPLHDHAVVATFYFKKASEFKHAYEMMVEENYRINNEFYVDSMPIFYNKMRKKTVIFDVDLYVGWGKPADLHAYEMREVYYRYGFGVCPDTGGDSDSWKYFFESLKS